MRDVNEDLFDSNVDLHLDLGRAFHLFKDRVRKGQVIAEPPAGALGALIHASIDGRVTAVGERIVIEKE